MRIRLRPIGAYAPVGVVYVMFGRWGIGSGWGLGFDKPQTEILIYGGAPRTNSNAYAEARVALKEAEEMTFCDEEIDKFLPPPLRRSRTKE